MKQIIEVEIDIPEGFDFVGYRRVEKGEFVLDGDDVKEWRVPQRSYAKYLVFQKSPPPKRWVEVTAEDVGEKVYVIDPDAAESTVMPFFTDIPFLRYKLAGFCNGQVLVIDTDEEDENPHQYYTFPNAYIFK